MTGHRRPIKWDNCSHPITEKNSIAKQSSKTQLLAEIITEHKRLENTLAKLPQEDILIPEVVGSWSVKDILAHLTAWEQLFLSWYQAGLREESPEYPPVGMSHTAIDQLNKDIYEKHKQDPPDKVWTEFHISYRQIVTMIESISEEELFTHQLFAWTGRWTLADYIAGNTCNHYRWAKSKIRQWQQARDR